MTDPIVYDIPPRHPHDVFLVSAEVIGANLAIVVGYNHKYYRSMDLGDHWSQTELPEEVAVSAPSDHRILYGYAEIGTIQRSTDGGTHWIVPHPLIEQVPSDQVAYKLSRNPDYRTEMSIVAVHPTKPLTLYATIRIEPARGPKSLGRPSFFLRGMYVSEDGGGTWKKFSDSVGIFDSYPRWVALGINPLDTNLMYSEGERDILRSHDGGKTWNPVGGSTFLNQLPVERSDAIDTRTSNRGQRALNIEKYAFDLHSKDTVYMVSKKGIYRSLDAGDTWSMLNTGYDSLGTIHGLAVDPRDGNNVLVGSRAGLHLSNDKGCHFRLLNTPSEATDALPVKPR